jgi:translation initiation factor 2 subunit 3
VGLKVDPYITRSDSLVGQIIGHPGSMPEVLIEIEVAYFLLKRLLGVRSGATAGDGEGRNKVSSLKQDEFLMINVGSQSLGGKVVIVKKDSVRIEFQKPVCANLGDKIAMSRRVDNNFRLIGWGEIKRSFNSQKYNR